MEISIERSPQHWRPNEGSNSKRSNLKNDAVTTLHDDKFERITFKSNDLSQTFFWIPDASLLITGIFSILNPDVMATKGYSFQYDEKTIIDIDIVTVAEKLMNEKNHGGIIIPPWKNVLHFFSEIFSSVKSDEFFLVWRNF